MTPSSKLRRLCCVLLELSCQFAPIAFSPPPPASQGHPEEDACEEIKDDQRRKDQFYFFTFQSLFYEEQRVMKTAFAVNRILPNPDANLAVLLSMANKATDAGAELGLFPEAALTGLINNDDPDHDLPLGQRIPGPVTDVLSDLSRDRSLWLSIGLLERAGDKLYDTAVLFTPDGDIGLKYRQIHPGWHSPDADPNVYDHGSAVPTLETPFGRMAFLICGDLFRQNYRPSL